MMIVLAINAVLTYGTPALVAQLVIRMFHLQVTVFELYWLLIVALFSIRMWVSDIQDYRK